MTHSIATVEPNDHGDGVHDARKSVTELILLMRVSDSQHTTEHERVNKLTLLICVPKDAKTALRREHVRQQTRKRVPSIVPREERGGHGGLAVSS